VNDEIAFLRAIANAPDDDAPRLVYADWLEERGDARAEFVRLEVERRHLFDRKPNRKAIIDERIHELTFQLDTKWVRRMHQMRNLLAGTRLDLAVVSDGKGLIDVRGSDWDTALLVEGRPIALNWDDCEGSIGQYLVLTGHERGDDYARQLIDFVSGDNDLCAPFAEQLRPLLSTFANGVYWLLYTPSQVPVSWTMQGYPDQSTLDAQFLQYYPFDDRNLVGTQPRESIDEGRVSFFRDRVRNGRRPIVLTVTTKGSWCEFVIDGHHKLEAYARERVRPAILTIDRGDPPEISVDEGIAYLPRGHAGVASYRRVKSRKTI